MTQNDWKRIQAYVPNELHKLAKLKSVETSQPLSDVLRDALIEWIGRDNIPENVLEQVEQVRNRG